MSDLISREAAIEALWKEPLCYDPLNVMAEARDRIEALPIIEAEPIKHGRWKPVEDADLWRGYVCSRCYKAVNQKENYCPRCGAKMDEAEE